MDGKWKKCQYHRSYILEPIPKTDAATLVSVMTETTSALTLRQTSAYSLL